MVIRYRISALIGLALLVLVQTAHADPARLTGKLAQGSLVYGSVEPGSRVWLGERAVRITSKGRFALGFARDAALEQTLKIEGPDGQVSRQTIHLAKRNYNIQRVDGVPSRTVTPSQSSLSRIHTESSRVRDARKTDSERSDFLGPFIWPASGPITGVYGSQRFYNGKPRNPHFGVDVAAPAGADVIAPAAGRVTLAEPDLFYSGGTLIIDHGYGVSSTFLHMSVLNVVVGQVVAKGEKIGEVGSTGRATGPHLDWRMNWYDVRVDPVSIAPPLVDGHTPKVSQPTVVLGKQEQKTEKVDQ